MHFAISHGCVTSADNNGDIPLLCNDGKVKMTLKPNVWATPTFKRGCMTHRFSDAGGDVNSSSPRMVPCLCFVVVVEGMDWFLKGSRGQES
jgi:hypothetical protein